MPKLINTTLVCVFACSALEAMAASAADFPTKTVRLVVTSQPGGANDVLGRMVAQRMTESLGRNVVVGIATVFSAAPHVKGGRLRALAVSSLKPLPALPGVPPLATEFPGFEMSLWHGYLTAAGTPAPIIAKLNAEIVKGLNAPAVREAVEGGGGESVGSSPAEFAAVIARDADKYAKLVKASGAKVE